MPTPQQLDLLGNPWVPVGVVKERPKGKGKAVAVDIHGKEYPSRADIPPLLRPYQNGWKPRKGNFAEAETVCETVRGVLIARLDDAFHLAIQPVLMEDSAVLVKINKDETNRSSNNLEKRRKPRGEPIKRLHY